MLSVLSYQYRIYLPLHEICPKDKEKIAVPALSKVGNNSNEKEESFFRGTRKRM